MARVIDLDNQAINRAAAMRGVIDFFALLASIPAGQFDQEVALMKSRSHQQTPPELSGTHAPTSPVNRHQLEAAKDNAPLAGFLDAIASVSIDLDGHISLARVRYGGGAIVSSFHMEVRA